MAAIKPTVGRIVHFFHTPADTEPLAAIVVKVHSDRLVNLTVFGQDGSTFNRSSVPLCQPEDPTPKDYGFCRWMPFQIGQADKTAALQKELDEVQQPAPPVVAGAGG